MLRKGVRRRIGGETGGDVATVSVRVMVARGGGLTLRRQSQQDFPGDWMWEREASAMTPELSARETGSMAHHHLR